jgi:hypothetical protein
MIKRAYSRPVVTKVRLDLKTSVMVACRLSLGNDEEAFSCKQGICLLE